MKKKKRKGALKYVFLIIALLVVFAILGGGIFYGLQTNGFTQFKMLEYNGQTASGTAKQVRLGYGEIEFEVKNYNPFRKTDYTVKIQPNGEESFNFTKDGNPLAFGGLGELTEYFEIEKGDHGFTLTVPSRFHSMQKFLQVVYPESEIEIPEAVQGRDADYFMMTVEFTDGERITVYFCMDFQTITLDPPNVIF